MNEAHRKARTENRSDGSTPRFISLLPCVHAVEGLELADRAGLDQEVEGAEDDGTGTGLIGDAEQAFHQFLIGFLAPPFEARLQEIQGTAAIVSRRGAGDRPGNPDGFWQVDVGVSVGEDLKGDGSAAPSERVARPPEGQALQCLGGKFPQDFQPSFRFRFRWRDVRRPAFVPEGDRGERLHQSALGDGAPRSRGVPDGTSGVDQCLGLLRIARDSPKESVDSPGGLAEGIGPILHRRVDEAPADVQQCQLECATLRRLIHGCRLTLRIRVPARAKAAPRLRIGALGNAGPATEPPRHREGL